MVNIGDNVPSMSSSNATSSVSSFGGNTTINRPSTIASIDLADPGSGGGSGGYDSGANADSQSKPGDKRVPFTIPGVLHFLQHEWSRIELERTHWEMERAELRARISFLQGERKGQENLKRDLIRRIKMLEHSLKQERIKLYRAQHNGENPPAVDEDDVPDVQSDVPLDVDSMVNTGEDPLWKRARNTLKQYMEEMGYSQELINIRAFRVNKLLGNKPTGENLTADEYNAEESRKVLDQTEQEVLATANLLKKYNLPKLNYADESEDRPGASPPPFDAETADALEEFSFLEKEADKTSTTRRSAPGWAKNPAGDEWGIDENTYKEMKDRYLSEMQHKKRQSSTSQSSVDSEPAQVTTAEGSAFDYSPYPGTGAGSDTTTSKSPGIAPGGFDSVYAGGDNPDDVDIKDEFTPEEEDFVRVRWNLMYTLRSHFDAVRALQFHPVEPMLITASEDGTAKLWNLSESKNVSEQAKSPSNAGIIDVEPVYTFRGHEKPILSIDLSPTGDNLYTADLDGIVCCWQVPPLNMEPHEAYDPSVLQTRFKAHTDAIWSINYHSSSNRLLTASADATIKVWDLSTSEESEYLLNTITFDGHVPRSMDIVSTEPQQVVVAFNGAKAVILDIETGQHVLSFEFPANEDIGEINKILSHPTMPVTVLAGDDRKIRYFDNVSGKQISGAVAHVEAISTLAIDPNGLYLMSGSHDGSLRIWNMEQKKCLQEIASHRKKVDMSVLAVAFHPSRPLIGSAGADSLTKIFTSQRLVAGVAPAASPSAASSSGDEST